MRTETSRLITILWLILLRTLSAGKSNGLLTWGEEGGQGGGGWNLRESEICNSSQVPGSEASFDF